MMRTVTLEQLPAGLEFPAEIQHRIRYDPKVRQLVFDGFMSKTDFDLLASVHRDVHYRRALERLFQICTIDSPVSIRTSTSRQWWLWAAIAAIVVLATAAWLRH